MLTTVNYLQKITKLMSSVQRIEVGDFADVILFFYIAFWTAVAFKLTMKKP